LSKGTFMYRAAASAAAVPSQETEVIFAQVLVAAKAACG